MSVVILSLCRDSPSKPVTSSTPVKSSTPKSEIKKEQATPPSSLYPQLEPVTPASPYTPFKPTFATPALPADTTTPSKQASPYTTPKKPASTPSSTPAKTPSKSTLPSTTTVPTPSKPSNPFTSGRSSPTPSHTTSTPIKSPAINTKTTTTTTSTPTTTTTTKASLPQMEIEGENVLEVSSASLYLFDESSKCFVQKEASVELLINDTGSEGEFNCILNTRTYTRTYSHFPHSWKIYFFDLWYIHCM